MSLSELVLIIGGPPLTTLSLWVAYLNYKSGSKAQEKSGENAANVAIQSGYGGLLQHYKDYAADLKRRLDECEAEKGNS